MNKQEAITFIQQKMDQGFDREQIASMLSRELNAPAEVVMRFVNQVADQYRPVRPAAPPRPAQQPQNDLPTWLQEARPAQAPAYLETPVQPAPSIPQVAAEPRTRKRFGAVEIGLVVVIVFLVGCLVGGLAWVVTNSKLASGRPTPTPIPGWEKFEGGGAEFWLPERFAGGDLSKDIDTIVESAKRLGPDFEKAAEMIKNNPSAFVIWAFDTQVGASGFLTNVNVVKEDVFFTTTLDSYMDTVSKQLPASMKIIRREKVNLERYEAVEMTIELDMTIAQAKELVYVIKNGNTMWLITYATGASDYPQMETMFKRSANTFVVGP